MKRKPATMQEIAQALGVSRATVSNALAGRGRVSPDMAAQVRDMAQALNYMPSGAGLALRTGRSQLIGLVVPDVTMPLFGDFVHAFERAAKARGLALMIGDSMGEGAQQRAQLRDFVARGVDALVLIPVRGADDDLPDLPVPLAVVDSAAHPANSAASDHRAGGAQMARHLLDLGHRQIALVLSAQASRVSEERGAGMADVLRAAGITPAILRLPPDFEAARALALAEGPGWRARGLSALCAAYDSMAVGLIAGLTAAGVAVPGAISVTGFDDIIWGRIVSPRLTTLRQDLGAIAEHALDVASGRALGPRLVPVQMVLRESTAPPPR